MFLLYVVYPHTTRHRNRWYMSNVWHTALIKVQNKLSHTIVQLLLQHEGVQNIHMSEHTLTVLVVLDDPDVRTVIHCKDNASAGGRGGGGGQTVCFYSLPHCNLHPFQCHNLPYSSLSPFSCPFLCPCPPFLGTSSIRTQRRTAPYTGSQYKGQRQPMMALQIHKAQRLIIHKCLTKNLVLVFFLLKSF